MSDYVAALTDTNYQKAYPAAKWDSLGTLINEASVLFSGDSLSSEHLAALKQGPVKVPASCPAVKR